VLRAIALGERDSSKGMRVGKTHAVRVEAARALLDVAVEAQAWDLACSAAEALADMYRKIYPQYSVATGVAEAKAAKLFWLLDNGAAARRHAKRALTHLDKLVPESALIAETQEVLGQVDMEATVAPSASIPDSRIALPAVVA
jgi:FAD/FMN-containing dehydrogenase